MSCSVKFGWCKVHELLVYTDNGWQDLIRRYLWFSGKISWLDFSRGIFLFLRKRISQTRYISNNLYLFLIRQEDRVLSLLPKEFVCKEKGRVLSWREKGIRSECFMVFPTTYSSYICRHISLYLRRVVLNHDVLYFIKYWSSLNK